VNEAPWDLVGSRESKAVLGLPVLVVRSDLWGRAARRGCAVMPVPRGTPDLLDFRAFAVTQVPSVRRETADPLALRVIPVRKVPWGQRVSAENRASADLPVSRGPSANRGFRERSARRVYRETGVAKVHRGSKAFRDLRAKKATRVKRENRAFRAPRGTPASRDLRAKKATRVKKGNTQGEKGEPGEKGEQGIQGIKGENGETPVVSVAEDTPLSYRLHFQTSEQELTTPNLYAPLTEYHVDLSAANSTLDIPLKALVLTYKRSSASALRISIAPKDAAASVLVDVRRTTIYDGSTIETQTMNNTTVSTSVAIDSTVYTNSQETHNMRIRQQDPATKLWSLCEINSFLSAGGARCSIRIQWSEYDVTYEPPTA